MAVPLSGRPGQRHLVIFLKAPRLGRVKRRLGRDIGSVEAWAFYRRTTAAIVRSLSRDPRWQTSLSVTPDRSLTENFRWPPWLPRNPQGSGDLGSRMYRALRSPGSGPLFGPVVLIGGDIPDIKPEHVAEAFRLLGSRDIVLGPALDGGFWLVGARRRPRLPYPFRDVGWSGAGTLADTIRGLDPRLSIGFAATLRDVDDGAALAAWRREWPVNRCAVSRAPAGGA